MPRSSAATRRSCPPARTATCPTSPAPTRFGATRTDLPLHRFKGANTFIPAVLPFHPAFGSEVDTAALQDGIAASTDNLRKAATVSGTIAGGTLTVP